MMLVTAIAFYGDSKWPHLKQNQKTIAVTLIHRYEQRVHEEM